MITPRNQEGDDFSYPPFYLEENEESSLAEFRQEGDMDDDDDSEFFSQSRTDQENEDIIFTPSLIEESFGRPSNSSNNNDDDEMMELEFVETSGDGILILSGSERTLNGDTDSTPELSLPSTADVPSDLESLEDMNDVAAKENGTGEESTTEQPPSEQSGADVDMKIATRTTTTDEQSTSSTATESTRLQHKISPLALLSAALAITCAKLVWEKNHWAQINYDLNEELEMMKEQMMMMTSNNSSIELPHDQLLSSVAQISQEHNDSSFKFDWEEEDESTRPCRPSNIDLEVDNCWLRAKASLALGDCANEVGSNVVHGLGSVVKGAWHAFSAPVYAFDHIPKSASIGLQSVSSLVSTTFSIGDILATKISEAIKEHHELSEEIFGPMVAVMSEASDALEDTMWYALNMTRDVIEDGTWTAHV